ncbi:MAG: 50S ribosomal protein L11 [Armatimonadetes bacterium]|nr:50S ribosomal protein L11 [Armatimonadota bacterium]MCX7967048.1 50S ribosomal protein L11 [Armatimonadota bacterium]MDW8142540.1 50S ribosomal protein L11 [Armatimonadota bacterium]
MAKKVVATVRLNLPAGKAAAGPPVGPTLAPYGINLMEFVKAYNEATREMIGTVIPVDVTIYSDRSFTFVLRRPPVAELLKKAAGIEKGSSAPNKIKVGKVTREQIREIALTKMPDLNTDDIEAAMRMVEGTARNMGIEIVP